MLVAYAVTMIFTVRLAWRLRALVRAGDPVDARRVLGAGHHHLHDRWRLGPGVPRGLPIRVPRGRALGRRTDARGAGLRHRIRNRAREPTAHPRLAVRRARVPDPGFGRERSGGRARRVAPGHHDDVDAPPRGSLRRHRPSSLWRQARRRGRDSRVAVRVRQLHEVRVLLLAPTRPSGLRDAEPVAAGSAQLERREPLLAQVHPHDRSPALPARRPPLRRPVPLGALSRACPRVRTRARVRHRTDVEHPGLDAGADRARAHRHRRHPPTTQDARSHPGGGSSADCSERSRARSSR